MRTLTTAELSMVAGGRKPNGNNGSLHPDLYPAPGGPGDPLDPNSGTWSQGPGGDWHWGVNQGGDIFIQSPTLSDTNTYLEATYNPSSHDVSITASDGTLYGTYDISNDSIKIGGSGSLDDWNFSADLEFNSSGITEWQVTAELKFL